MAIYKNNGRNAYLRILLFILLLCSASISYANADAKRKKTHYPSYLHEIKGILIEEHDSDWYSQQYVGWLDLAMELKNDEYAWLNCFMAKNYFSQTLLGSLRSKL